MITSEQIAIAIRDALMLLPGIDCGGDDLADFAIDRDGNDVVIHVWAGPRFRISVVLEG